MRAGRGVGAVRPVACGGRAALPSAGDLGDCARDSRSPASVHGVHVSISAGVSRREGTPGASLPWGFLVLAVGIVGVV